MAPSSMMPNHDQHRDEHISGRILGSSNILSGTLEKVDVQRLAPGTLQSVSLPRLFGSSPTFDTTMGRSATDP